MITANNLFATALLLTVTTGAQGSYTKNFARRYGLAA